MLKKSINTFLFLILFIASFFCKASDSLKVKKTEYYEDGKLVRAEYYDSLGRKSKEILNNFLFEENKVYTYFYENNMIVQINTLNATVIGDSLQFNNNYNLGNERTLKYYKNRLVESHAMEFELTDKKDNLTYSVIKIYNILSKRKYPSSSLKYFYDTNGNIKKLKYTFGMNIKEETNFKYEIDSLNRIVKKTGTNSKGQITEQTNFYFSDTSQVFRKLYYNKGILQLIVLNKVFNNSKNQEVKDEQFENNSLGVKLTSELYPTRKTQIFYEKDRIIKIIYEFIQDKITKTHELKYEFY